MKFGIIHTDEGIGEVSIRVSTMSEGAEKTKRVAVWES